MGGDQAPPVVESDIAGLAAGQRLDSDDMLAIARADRGGEQRLRQNGRQDALYVFDGQVDIQQPLTVSYETAHNDDWGSMLPQIERERALVKSRASARRVP